MTKKSKVRAVYALILAFSLMLTAPAISCSQEISSADKIGVAVSIPPQAEFVARVGGDKVNITIMVPPGANPHTYEPRPNQMTELARVKIYAQLGSGIEFERVYLDKLVAINQDMLLVDCSRGVNLIASQDPDEPGMDPHTWLSPLNVRTIVQNICDGLVQIDPANRAYYEDNRDRYLQELADLDQDIRTGLARMTNRTFMVYHPAFAYFAAEYDLVMLPIEAEGKEPTAAALTRLIEQARASQVKTILTSPQFNPQSARIIAEAIGGRLVFIDYLAEGYLASMRQLLDELTRATE
ncbi:MAG: zinc ABC transporter substrate-binding protein [Dehalococcoidales bacterium]|nr:zinc ABC transporter substrate-binding protein [Dehalococcoidales bacterium]